MNNTPTIISTTKGEVMIVPIPEDTSRIFISDKGNLCFTDGGDGLIKSYPIGDDDEILGEIKDGVIDFDCSDFFYRIGAGDKVKFNDTSDVLECKWVSEDGKSISTSTMRNMYDSKGTVLVEKKISSNDSFLSLLRKNNLDVTKGKWVVILIDDSKK